MMIVIFLAAVCYFYFHREFFLYVDDCIGTRAGRSLVILTFALNYSIFMACSYLQLHLVYNWSVLILAWWLQIWLIYRRPAVVSAYFALCGAIAGLSVNILLRCVFALALSRPLADFNNQTLASDNIKRYPVLLGFLIAGLIFRAYRGSRRRNRMDELLGDLSTLRFLTIVMAVLYFYLVLNLTTYYTGGREVSLKLWGIKSVIFVEIAVFISTVYCTHMSRLKLFQEKARREREALLRERDEKENARLAACTDALTGCYNRRYAMETLEEKWAGEKTFCLCLLDINELSAVNHSFGRQEGDSYLAAVAGAIRRHVRKGDGIFRYGGDEFLVLFHGIAPREAEDRMYRMNLELARTGREEGKGYAMSVSCGAAGREEAKDADSLIRLADERMRRHKRKNDIKPWRAAYVARPPAGQE